MAICRAHRGLPVGFLLLRFSVLFTVESLSLLYLLVISYFLYILGDDTLISWGSFMLTKYLCVSVRVWVEGGVGPLNWFKPSSEIFY